MNHRLTHNSSLPVPPRLLLQTLTRTGGPTTGAGGLGSLSLVKPSCFTQEVTHTKRDGRVPRESLSSGPITRTLRSLFEIEVWIHTSGVPNLSVTSEFTPTSLGTYTSVADLDRVWGTDRGVHDLEGRLGPPQGRLEVLQVVVGREEREGQVTPEAGRPLRRQTPCHSPGPSLSSSDPRTSLRLESRLPRRVRRRWVEGWSFQESPRSHVGRRRTSLVQLRCDLGRPRRSDDCPDGEGFGRTKGVQVEGPTLRVLVEAVEGTAVGVTEGPFRGRDV